MALNTIHQTIYFLNRFFDLTMKLKWLIVYTTTVLYIIWTKQACHELSVPLFRMNWISLLQACNQKYAKNCYLAINIHVKTCTSNLIDFRNIQTVNLVQENNINDIHMLFHSNQIRYTIKPALKDPLYNKCLSIEGSLISPINE